MPHKDSNNNNNNRTEKRLQKSFDNAETSGQSSRGHVKESKAKTLNYTYTHIYKYICIHTHS